MFVNISNINLNNFCSDNIHSFGLLSIRKDALSKKYYHYVEITTTQETSLDCLTFAFLLSSTITTVVIIIGFYVSFEIIGEGITDNLLALNLQTTCFVVMNYSNILFSLCQPFKII